MFDFKDAGVLIHSYKEKESVLKYADREGYSTTGITADAWKTHDVVGYDEHYSAMNAWNHRCCPSRMEVIDFEEWINLISIEKIDFSAVESLI